MATNSLRLGSKVCGVLCLAALVCGKARGEQWVEFPEHKGVTSLAAVGSSMWFLSDWSNWTNLYRFQDGKITAFDSTDFPSLASDGWYEDRLFGGESSLFLDRLNNSSRWYPPAAEIVRFDDRGFANLRSFGQFVHAGKTGFYLFKDARIFRWSGGDVLQAVGDSVPGLRSHWFSGGFGQWSYLSVFQPDGKGRFWYAGKTATDMIECSPLYLLDEADGKSVEMNAGQNHVCYEDAAMDASGEFYFASSEGLIKYDGKQFVNITAGAKGIRKRFSSVFVDGQDRVWAGAGRWDSTTQLVLVDKGKITVKKEFKLEKGTGHITDIAGDAEGNVWIAGMNIPLTVYNDKTVTGISGRAPSPEAAVASPRLGPGMVAYRGNAYDLRGVSREGIRRKRLSW